MAPTQFSYIRNTFGDYRGRLWLLALVLVLGLSSIPDRALAQRLSAATEKTSLGVWSGVSFDSPGGPLLGRVRNREFFIVGIRYGRMLAESRRFALEYVLDVIPIAIITKNPTEEDILALAPAIYQHPESILDSPLGRNVYGAGVAPMGLQVHFGRRDFVSLFGGASAGFLYFSENVPVPNARKFNFTVDAGAGITVRPDSGWGSCWGTSSITCPTRLRPRRIPV